MKFQSTYQRHHTWTISWTLTRNITNKRVISWSWAPPFIQSQISFVFVLFGFRQKEFLPISNMRIIEFFLCFKLFILIIKIYLFTFVTTLSICRFYIRLKPKAERMSNNKLSNSTSKGKKQDEQPLQQTKMGNFLPGGKKEKKSSVCSY